MNKQQDSRLAMYRTLRNIYQKNLEIIKAIPALAAAMDLLSDLIGRIEKTAESQATVYNTKTRVKHSEKSGLVQRLYPAVAALHALGHELGDVVLQGSTDYTEGQLQTSRDQELLRIADISIGLVQSNAANLTAYGMTPERITALTAARDAYYDALHGRDAGLALRKATQPNLKSLYGEGNTLIDKKLDRLMVMLRDEHPALYEEYGKARLVRYAGIRHRPPDEATAASTPPADSQSAVPSSAPVQPAAVTIG
jgi:hypothetical protein